MTHIEQMIQDLCPNGIEWKTIKETVGVNRGRRLTKSQLKEDGLYEVYHGSKDTPLGRYDDYNAPKDTIIVVNTGGIGGVKYLDKAFWCSDGSFWLGHSTGISNKFLYYFLSRYEDYFESQKRVGGVPTIDRNVVENFEIPVPPIEIQQRIVAILDAFSALAAELQAELQMRRKQYEYYRTQLLTPHSDCNSADNTDDCKWVFKALGDITFLAKERIPAEELSEDNYVSVENLLSNKLGKTLSESVPVEGAFIKYIKNDILVGNIRPYLRKIWFADTDGGTNGDVLTIRIKEAYKTQILPRFLFHVLSSEEFFFYDTNFSKGAKMPRGDKDKVMQYPVVIPSLKEQERIVSILDKFEALTTSLSDGIPAEQALQQKRYEYYRDKLLTFEKRP